MSNKNKMMLPADLEQRIMIEMQEALDNTVDIDLPHVYSGEKGHTRPIVVRMSDSLVSVIGAIKETFDPLFPYTADVVRTSVILTAHALLQLDTRFKAQAQRTIMAEQLLNRELIAMENIERISGFVERLGAQLAWFSEHGYQVEAWESLTSVLRIVNEEPSPKWRDEFLRRAAKHFFTHRVHFRRLSESERITGLEDVEQQLHKYEGAGYAA